MEIKNKNTIRVTFILLIGVFIGWLLFGGKSSNKADQTNQEHNHMASTTWTCSMHPQIRQNEPGDCPICGMELISVSLDNLHEDPALVVMSEYAQKLANVQTMVVGDRNDAGQIRLNGKVAVDERRSYVQSSHIAGRVEQLMVNFTGETVSRGQALARLYSPELMTAQKELLQAYSIRASNPVLFDAAKERLKQWKITDRQINNIIERGQVSDQFTIYADVGGVVTEKLVELGDYIKQGEAIYQIANLEQLWVQFDAYERTINWIKEGSTISFTVGSLPGETFVGKVDFVDPLLNDQTRVSSARVVVDNSEGRLKPGMFATGILEIPVQEEGQLSVPKSAVLWTGERSIVYVKEHGGFKLRNVVLGAELGGAYMIAQGLNPAEEIVVNGTFTVDAAAQLAGKPSMMTAPKNQALGATESTLFELPSVEHKMDLNQRNQMAIKQLIDTYLKLKDALVEDDFQNAKAFTSQLWEAVEKVNLPQEDAKTQQVWEGVVSQFDKAKKMTLAKDIDGLRAYFELVSELMIYTLESFELSIQTIYLQHCPMANSDQGANWLSRSKEVMNPYFGSQMRYCGEVERAIN